MTIDSTSSSRTWSDSFYSPFTAVSTTLKKVAKFGLLILGAQEAIGATTPFPSLTEFQVSSSSTNNQQAGSVGSFPNGDYMIAWGLWNEDPYVQVREFPASGENTIPNLLINHPDDERVIHETQLVTFPNGEFEISWISGEKTRKQRFTSDGVADSEIIEIRGGDEKPFTARRLSDSTFLYAFPERHRDEYDVTHNEIFGLPYEQDGTLISDLFLMSREPYIYSNQDDEEPCIAPQNEQYFLGWRVDSAYSGPDDDGSAIQGRFFYNNHTPISGVFTVNNQTEGYQMAPTCDSSPVDDSVTIAWHQSPIIYLPDATEADVFRTRLDASGNTINPEERVNTFTQGKQSHPKVAVLKSGRSVITWQSDNQDGSGESVHFQMYDEYGNKMGEETLVNTVTTNNQNGPRVGATEDGGFVITWSSEGQGGSGRESLMAKKFDSDGNPVLTDLIPPFYIGNYNYGQTYDLYPDGKMTFSGGVNSVKPSSTNCMTLSFDPTNENIETGVPVVAFQFPTEEESVWNSMTIAGGNSDNCFEVNENGIVVSSSIVTHGEGVSTYELRFSSAICETSALPLSCPDVTIAPPNPIPAPAPTPTPRPSGSSITSGGNEDTSTNQEESDGSSQGGNPQASSHKIASGILGLLASN